MTNQFFDQSNKPNFAAMMKTYQDKLDAEQKREEEEGRIRQENKDIEREAEAKELYIKTREALGPIADELGLEFFPQFNEALPLITIGGRTYLVSRIRYSDRLVLETVRGNREYSLKESGDDWIAKAFRRTFFEIGEHLKHDTKETTNRFNGYDVSRDDILEAYKQFEDNWGSESAVELLQTARDIALIKVFTEEKMSVRRDEQKEREAEAEKQQRQSLLAAIENDDVAITLVKLFTAIQKEREEWQGEIENWQQSLEGEQSRIEEAYSELSRARDEAAHLERRARDAEYERDEAKDTAYNLERKAKRAGVAL